MPTGPLYAVPTDCIAHTESEIDNFYLFRRLLSSKLAVMYPSGKGEYNSMQG
jgi:hypothetical protein